MKMKRISSILFNNRLHIRIIENKITKRINLTNYYLKKNYFSQYFPLSKKWQIF